MKANNKYHVIDVPLEKANVGRETVATNTSLQGVLRKKTAADVISYAMPTADSNVYCRHTMISKIDKARLPEDGDHPDLNDLYDTDLPWTGYVTFKGSSRQFRARYGLQVYTRMIKEYDGVLYELTEGELYNQGPPVLIKVDKHDLSASYVRLTIIDDTPTTLLNHHFHGTTLPPKSLHDEMAQIGYVWQKDRFVTTEDLPYSEILCRIYGKFLTPSTGR